jgi:predicted phage terminase large subunit-like protein
VISTRFHTDDLFGRLEATGKYKTIVLPAVASEHDEIGRAPGDWLWDTDPNYPYGQFLRDQFEIQPPEIWASLFLQNPIVEGGNFFKADWIKPYHQIPDRRTMHIYGASDYALTEGGGDFTVHVVVGLTPQNDLYLLDMWRRQADSATSVDAFLDLVREWRPLGWSWESGQIRAALGPYIKLRQRQRNIYVATQTFPTKGDKAIRAQSIRGRMATGGLFVPQYAEFLPALKSELLSFPAGKHDDIVDALGLIGQILDRMSPGRPLEEKPRPKVLSFEPGKTTLTLTELFEENERRHKRYQRIS